MKNARRTALAIVLAATQAAGFAQTGIVRGEAAGGERYLAGGIGQDEIAVMQVAREGFSLSVRTAARGSGAYLADVHLRIADDQGRPLFDEDLAGPWLLIALRPGRYALEARRGAELHQAAVSIAAGGLREQVFYFEVGREASDPGPDPVERPPAAR